MFWMGVLLGLYDVEGEDMKPNLDGFELRATMIASILAGLLASSPLCDCTKINKRKWVRVAKEWADIVLDETRKPTAVKSSRRTGRG